MIHSAKGLHYLAIASYQQALVPGRPHPDPAAVWGNLGNEFAKSGKPDSAIAAYREAIELGRRKAIVNLASLCYRQGRYAEAVTQVGRLLQEALDCIARYPFQALYEFNIWHHKMLRDHTFMSSVCPHAFPGSGQHLVDHYLAAAQDVLLNGLRADEIDQTKSLKDLSEIGMLWCHYGQTLLRKGASRQFTKEQLYAIRQGTEHVPQAVRDATGFASIIHELTVRIGATSDEEFIQEMLKLEGPWLRSAGEAQERGVVQDLRFRLKGNAWVHAFEWTERQLDADLEHTHYYMELLKGHTLLHKVVDSTKLTAPEDKVLWARCSDALPVRLDSHVVVDTKMAIRNLPKTGMAISYYFLHRELLPDLMFVVLIERGKRPRLKIVDTGKRLEIYQNAAMQLKNVHDRVAWRPKTAEVGKEFSELAGLENTLKGRPLAEAVAQWERDRLHEAFKAVVEDVIDIREITGKDLYISPAPEMYDIPFGLLYTGENYLNNVASSITVAPIFSLRKSALKASVTERENMVLCLDDHWANDAALRRGSLLNCRGHLPDLHIESQLLECEDNNHAKYDEWMHMMGGTHTAHIIGHHDARQWSRRLEGRPNMGQFGRYLYEAPNRLAVDLLGLEACWGGTWADPEDLMGLFVSFLASGVNRMIASPYSLVPSETSGRLFSNIYRNSAASGRTGCLQLARIMKNAAAEVGTGNANIEDTIPTLWGALQLYVAL